MSSRFHRARFAFAGLVEKTRPWFAAAGATLIAAGLAALAANVAIDVIGDFALRHDTYDDTGHASRAVAVLFVLAGLGVFGLRTVLAAADGRRGRAALERTLVAPRSPLPIVLGTALGALIAAIGMGVLDSLAAGGALDLADDLGGSVLLGVVTTLPLALAAGWAAWAALRRVSASRDALVRAVGAMLETILAVRLDPVWRFVPAHAPLARRRYPFAYRTAKRGPPLFP
jgi:hypothetical protein